MRDREVAEECAVLGRNNSQVRIVPFVGCEQRVRYGVGGITGQGGWRIQVFYRRLGGRQYWSVRQGIWRLTPLYLLDHLERVASDDEAISAILEATLLLPTGIEFDTVADMVGQREI